MKRKTHKVNFIGIDSKYCCIIVNNFDITSNIFRYCYKTIRTVLSKFPNKFSPQIQFFTVIDDFKYISRYISTTANESVNHSQASPITNN